MTKPRYPRGCAAGSQEHGHADASDLESFAWNVDLNNGNSNLNNQTNHGLALAVRGPVAVPGEYRGATFRALWEAAEMAGRQKTSFNQLRVESRMIDVVLDLERELDEGTWQPSPYLCFIADQPKAREIHAPCFRDRIVHHWLVPQLEALFEPRFIYDSYANRRGKGTHAAVSRLRSFVRQVDSGQGGGWYLQIDVARFFPSIDRPTLYEILKRRMVEADLPLAAQRVTHALLRHSAARTGVRYRATAEERARVPPAKRLENAPPGRGLPIGNLPSQFFANVYLDPLDQFAKHILGIKRYLRYADDIVIVHHDREQLRTWLGEIQRFLGERLKLKLKDDIRLRPLDAGIDFLGFVVHPTHTRIRRRVVQHARQKLWQWQQNHIQGGQIRATPEQLRHVNSVWASYGGQFSHANSFRLRSDFHRRFTWLHCATSVQRRFDHRLEGRRIAIDCFHQPPQGGAFKP